MIRRVRRSIELRDDQAAVELVLGVGRRTIRISFQSTRNDGGGRGRGLFGRSPSPQHGLGPDDWFDVDALDIDDEGFVELGDGRRLHVDDPRFLSLLH